MSNTPGGKLHRTSCHTHKNEMVTYIIGKDLSYLFVTATEFDLNTIHSSVSRLAKSQGDTSCCG